MSKRNEGRRVRILMTEDHVSTRLGVRQILKEEFPLLHFGQASDATSTLSLLQKEEWDLLILDIALPGQSGVELLSDVKVRRPELPVLVYSAHREEDFALPMLRAGAAGYLTKERAPEELCLAVEQILRGGTYISQTLSGRLLKPGVDRTPLLPHEALSAREFQVLHLVAKGRMGKEVALELGLSQKTVSTYRTRILRKLKLHSTAELIQYAVREGLA